jgi:hypothetical protein
MINIRSLPAPSRCDGNPLHSKSQRGQRIRSAVAGRDREVRTRWKARSLRHPPAQTETLPAPRPFCRGDLAPPTTPELPMLS